MKPTWSVKNEISKRAKRESDYNWAISNTSPELPKYENPPKIKLTAGVFNFIKSNVLEFRP